MGNLLSPQSANAYLTLFVVVVLPLLPAFVLFKALPTDAKLEGPLQGMNLKFSGAFAGYFAILLLVLSTHSVWNPPDNYQVWTVSGVVADETGAGVQPLDSHDIRVQPSSFEAQQAGSFTMKIYTSPGQGNTEAYPVLMVSHGDLSPLNIDLDPASADRSSTIKWDPATHKIRLGLLKLQKNTAYHPTVVPIQQPAPAGPH